MTDVDEAKVPALPVSTDKTGVWRICVDTGGTFTDCVAQSPSGEEVRAKVLSSGALRGRILRILAEDAWEISASWQDTAPNDFVAGFEIRLLGNAGSDQPDYSNPVLVKSYDAETRTIRLSSPHSHLAPRAGASIELLSNEEAPILAARLVTCTAAGKALPPLEMRLATTRGTNALLEEKGARVVFFVTKGHADLLRIGTQQRPDLFALNIQKTEPLHYRVVEVPERLAADGSVLIPLELPQCTDSEASSQSAEIAELERLAKDSLATGCTSAAIALMHSYRNPVHEEALAVWLMNLGFAQVSASAALAGRIKLIPRAETCVADAYLAPILHAYLSRVAEPIQAGSPDAAEQNRLHVMTSAGGLVSRRLFRPKDSLLSGPAGGLVGAATVARRAGWSRLIGFDMGGTSTDVARFDGVFDYAVTHSVGRARLVGPALKIESVAAGGGSICGYRHGHLFVGPESAGANPGPACYGAGGPLALTDVHLLLGRLDAARLGIPVDRAAAERRLTEIIEAIVAESVASVSEGTPRHPTSESVLHGFLEIADEIMAGTIRKISVREGYEPASYGIVAFGGAGGLHACRVARRLGISRVLHPHNAGLLSAFGLRQAGIERFAEKQVLLPLNQIAAQLRAMMRDLTAQATEELLSEGVEANNVVIRARWVEARLAGQDSAIMLELPSDDSVAPQELITELFTTRYKAVFGYPPPNRALEIVSLRTAVTERTDVLSEEHFPDSTLLKAGNPELCIIDRADVHPGTFLQGPALVQDGFSTIYIEEGWSARGGSEGSLLLEFTSQDQSSSPVSGPPPFELQRELFTQRFLRLVEETGLLLQRTALSTNVKERLDFSCALLDSNGELVANAPHIPVHLGALGLCVRRVAAALPMGPGDVAVTNHPAHGGSHLPDVTVLGPVHAADGSLLGYIANRAHHAEMGGIRPGSMPPAATCLADEGVVISPRLLVRNGEADWSGMEAVLCGGLWPTRALADNLADLHAQLAAHRRGVELLRGMADEYGADEVRRFMALMSDDAAARLSTKLSERAGESPANGTSAAPSSWKASAEEKLDDGATIRVAMEIADGRLRLDLTGTTERHPGNLNATEAIVRSVIMYVLRVWIAEPIPLNEGLMRPVDLILPPRSFLNPEFPADAAQCPAVVGGNVETSQRLADTLLKALGIAACSQGTMNNVIFGNARCSYYETVCGGAGAGPGFAGADGVHTHMTNTAITDPEVLEHRFPVRLHHFGIRPNSGGEGQYRGGNGIVRELEFLEPMSLSLLTQHRREEPYGVAGGSPGKCGRQILMSASDESSDSAQSAQLPPVAGVEVSAGDRLILETPGGGGWGKSETTCS
ncbi:MAG TPA: hydantoinase B/oxoprolinase family protein [Candidatus Methylacidiphilales bacterium]|nr:hydantoinase B/oxoprolinase family protein [Candidatus Methylacidiphilales bacterium]